MSNLCPCQWRCDCDRFAPTVVGITNQYTRRFSAKCPNNGESIDYVLIVESVSMIGVEEVVAATDAIVSGFHEDIADKLHDRFGGLQTLEAYHHGVWIKTVRGGA